MLIQSRTGNASNVSSSTLAFLSNVVSGNLLVVSGGVWTGATTTTMAITDTRGTSYTVLLGPEGIQRTWIAYGLAPSSGACTVTINPTPDGAYQAYVIVEFSEVTTPPLDVDGGTSTGTGTTASDGITTVGETTLVIGTMSHFDVNNDALTPDTAGGWIELGEYEIAGTITNYNCAYQRFTSAGAKTASWTIGASRTWGAQTVSFKETAASAVPFPRSRPFPFKPGGRRS